MGVPVSSKQRILELIRVNPFLSQQDLADQSGISRSAVASHIASLMRDRQLLGRAYVLPGTAPVLVLGGANLDRIATSLAPVSPATSNPVRVQESFGGVARNVAENLARLGLPVRLMTAVGEDAQGQALLKQARDLGIDTGPSLVLAGQATGTYTAILQPDGEMVLGMADMSVLDHFTLDALASRRSHWCATQVRVADLNLPAPVVAALLEDSRSQEALLVVVAVSVPKMARLPGRLDGIAVLILNAGELAARVGRALPDRAALRQACREVQAQGAREVVVTLGEGGVIHTCGSRVPRHLLAPRARVVNVTGAGDAFSAGVVASLVRHPGDLALACRTGLRLAAVTLGSASTVAPTLTPGFLQEPET